MLKHVSQESELHTDNDQAIAAACCSVTGLDAELRLVHPRLSAPVAEALGVASRRRLMLAASADCLALGLAGAGGAVEAFGQSEALTTRLRHIIQVCRATGLHTMSLNSVPLLLPYDCHLTS